MASESAQEVPSLIQDPQDTNPKPIFLSKKEDPTQLDLTKVMAAVGFILTATIVIVGLMWITLQNLEERVKELEAENKVFVSKNSASEAAAKLASKAASKSTETKE